MKKKYVLSVIASVCCALTAAADFSGSWEGTWYSVWGSSGWMAADVSQDGNALSGWLDYETAYYGNFGMPITGTVSGEVADMAGSIIVEGSTYRIQYTQAQLSPSGTTLSGNYTITEDGVPWDGGTFEMQKPSSGPENDYFADAATLSGASGQVFGSNLDATKENGEPDHAGYPGGVSVWWKWTAPYNGDVVIDTFGSDFDTLLAVYMGSSVGNLDEIASNDQAAEGNQSEVSFVAVANTTYWIAVDGYYGEVGGVVLNWAGSSMLAGTVGDDFNDNIKDMDKWGEDVLFGTGVSLQEANGRLQFSGNGEAGIVRPWIYSSGSYTSNWEVSTDVYIGDLSLQQNNDIEMFFGIAPPNWSVRGR